MDDKVMIGGNCSLDSHDHDGSVLINNVIKENENPKNIDFLEEDINNRLTVSRFVSDLVTKGILNAVETEAAEKIARKEIKLSRLKETLLLYHVGSEESETSYSRSILDKPCKDESEQRLLEQNVESCGKKSLLLDQKTKAIAGLRCELELISKLLSGPENGDILASEDRKRTDLLHRRISGSLGKHVGSATSRSENLEDLRQLSREQLIKHFTSEMNRLKREHDYTMQEMTEEYFSIKRRYLKLEECCGSFSSLKKDKEFDGLRKKIPDIISKLDSVLLEDEEPVFERKYDADQLGSLLLENRQLKDSLSEADKKMSQLSQVEANQRKLIRTLESDVKDLHVEASIYEDVYGSFVGEFVNQIQCAKEESDLEHRTMRESFKLISRDLVDREEPSERKIDPETSWFESYMGEENCAVIYKEALKEADKKLGELNKNGLEKERALRSEMVEKERLKEQIHWLECFVKEKDYLVQVAENDLATEREKVEIVFHQINNLQFQMEQQAVVIQDKNKELKVVSARSLEKTEGYEMEISELRQKLELARKNMKITENEKVKSELKISSTRAEHKRIKNQIVSMVLSLAKWSQGFEDVECLISERMKRTNSRLKSMQSQLNDLSDEVDELKERESMYKQQMEKKACDLQKAETEVDLLGDEIDSLLDLFEKIYIALDHYSPILKHYTGIIEILKLVRKELRRDQRDDQSSHQVVI